jgi:hypothetical protein
VGTELSLEALALALERVGMVTLEQSVGVLEALRLDGTADTVFVTGVLSHLDPLDRLSLGQVSQGWRALVQSAPALDAAPEPRELSMFVGSVERFAWAKAAGCPWWGSNSGQTHNPHPHNPQTPQTPVRGSSQATSGVRCGPTIRNPDTTHLIATFGSLEVLQWARRQDPPCPWDARTCAEAAGRGDLPMLKWARLHGCEWDERVCEFAACHGHLDVLQWVRSGREHLWCQWSEQTCAEAAGGGQMDVLQWLRRQDPPCPWDVVTCAEAAGRGDLPMLKWARQQHPPCPWGLCRRPFRPRTLRPDRANGCDWNGLQKWTVGACTSAAGGGHLDVLQWLRDPVVHAPHPPCQWDMRVSYEAAAEGHLELMQWARAQEPPCPWSQRTCSEAAIWGHLHILQWLRANGCPWHKNDCASRCRNHPEALAWVISQDE